MSAMERVAALAPDRRSPGGPLSHHPGNPPGSLIIECIGAPIIQRLWDLTELVRLNVDVILTGVNQGIVAARRATTTIPIVMVYGIDPVGAGFIRSLAHPGGNITGGTFEASPLIYGKKLEYLKQINPKLTRVALLWNPAATAARAYLEATKDGARRLDLLVQSVEVRMP